MRKQALPLRDRIEAAAKAFKGEPLLASVPPSSFFAYGPEDDVITRKGLDGYIDMAWTDAEVSSCLWHMLTLSIPGVSVAPEDDSPEAERNAAFVDAVLNLMDGSTLDTFQVGLLNAIITGFTIQEPAWMNVLVPGVGAAIGLRGLDVRPSKSFVDAIEGGINVDKYGQVISFKQSSEYGGGIVTPDQVVYWAHLGGPDQRYGVSCLRPIYEPWAAKQKIRRTYQMFMATNASGLRRVGIPDKVFDRNNRAAAKEAKAVVEKLGTLATMSYPQSWDVNIDVPSSGAGAHFKAMLDWCNAEIRRGLLGDSAFSSQDGSGGSYASREVSQQNVQGRFAALGRSYMESVTEQLCPMVLEMNGLTGPVPKLIPLAAVSGPQARESAFRVLGDLKAAGILTVGLPDAAQLKILRTIAEPLDVEITEIQDEEEIDGVLVETSDDGDVQSTALNGAQVAALLEIANACAAQQLPIDTAIAIAHTSFPAVSEETIRAIFEPLKAFKRPEPVPPVKAAEGQKQKRGRRQADALRDEIVRRAADLSQTWDAIMPAVQEQISKGLFEAKQGGGWKTTDLTAIRQIITDKTRYKSAEIRNSIMAGLEASRELGTKAASDTLPVRAAAGRRWGWTSASAKKALANRVMFLIEQRYGLLASSIYYMIENALIGSLSITVAESRLRDLLAASPWNEGRAMTVMATSMATAWNEARMQQYADLEDVNGTGASSIVAYEFVAVDDEQTTDGCLELNGKIFSADDPELPQPPLHYHCRSLLMPVFGDEKDKHTIMDHKDSARLVSRVRASGGIQEGFGGA